MTAAVTVTDHDALRAGALRDYDNAIVIDIGPRVGAAGIDPPEGLEGSDDDDLIDPREAIATDPATAIEWCLRPSNSNAPETSR